MEQEVKIISSHHFELFCQEYAEHIISGYKLKDTFTQAFLYSATLVKEIESSNIPVVKKAGRPSNAPSKQQD